MAYQALYRQWRPVDFSSMVSQEAIVATLRNQITTGRIAHAYLFCGSRGTGKTSTAKIMARAVNCEHPVNGDPCGQCDSCRRLLSDESLDVMEFDAASNSRVEDARDLLETVKYPSWTCSSPLARKSWVRPSVASSRCSPAKPLLSRAMR